jgi:hypothetical protein
VIAAYRELQEQLTIMLAVRGHRSS